MNYTILLSIPLFISITFILYYLIDQRHLRYFPRLIYHEEERNVFIDLGANKGDSVYNFFGLSQKSQGGNINSEIFEKFPGSLKNKKWIVYVFEANQIFDKQLYVMKQRISSMGHIVHLFNQTAAWTNNGTIDFYLDTVNEDVDFWGSSLKANHHDVIKSNSVKTTVNCVDIAGIIKKYNIKDNIIIKMDIEGAEYDLLQDFIRKNAFELVDYIAVEFHQFVSPFKRPDDVFVSLIRLFGVKFLAWER